MIIVFLNRKVGAGKTTPALHLAGQWASEGKRVSVIDTDPQGSALDRPEQRTGKRLPDLFGVIGLTNDTLHREAPRLAQSADRVPIDDSPRVGGPTGLAVLAADLVLLPDRITARLTIDITSEHRDLIRFPGWRHGSGMCRELVTRKFPDDPGDQS